MRLPEIPVITYNICQILLSVNTISNDLKTFDKYFLNTAIKKISIGDITP